MSDLLKIAADLEAMADTLDIEATEKHAAEKQARQDALKVLADKYATVTGETLSEAETAKLAQSDPDIVRLLSGIVEKQAGAVETMGGPATGRIDPAAPKTVKEAADQAADRFAAWAIS